MPGRLLPRKEEAAQTLTEGLVKLAVVAWAGPVGGAAAEALSIAAAFAGLAAKQKIAGRTVAAARRQAREIAAGIARDLLEARAAEGADPAAVERAAAALAPALERLEPRQVLDHLDDPGAIAEALRASPAAAQAFNGDPDGAREHEALVRALVPRLAELVSDRQLLETAAGEAQATRKGVRRLEERAEAADRAAEAALAQDRGRVRKALGLQAARVELLGLDLAGSSVARDLPLESAFLPLTLRGGPALKDARLDLDGLLTVLPGLSGRLLVEGLAGMGKTTLLQWILQETLRAFPGRAASAAERRRRLRIGRGLAEYLEDLLPSSVVERSEDWRQRSAFLLPLRRLEEGRLPGPKDLAERIARELGVDPSPWIARELECGRALLLLDGVDELPRAHRRELRKGLERLFEALPGCHFVVTSRPGAVEDPDWERLFPEARATIEPMGPWQIETFVRNWHEAYRSACAAVRRKPRYGDAGRGLVEQIRATRALEQLASVPLLCAAICLLRQAGIGELPRRKAELLQKLAEMLVHGRDEERLSASEKARFGPALAALGLADKLVLLERLARLTFDRDPETPELPTAHARDEIGEGLASLPEHARRLDPGAVLDLLAERSGVLRRVGADAVGFVHNLLRTWLAAGRFATEGRRLRPLVEAAFDADDRDLVPLAATRADPKIRASLIGYLLDRAERPRERERAHRLRLWALRARESGEVADRALDRRLQALGAAELAPRDPDEAGELAELGEAMLPWLERRPEQSAREAAAAVRCLRLVGGAEARRRIEAYLDHDDPEVVLELGLAVDNPLDVPKIRQAVSGETPLSERVLSLPIGDEHLRDAVERGLLDGEPNLDLTWTSVSDLRPLHGLDALELVRVYPRWLQPGSVEALRYAMAARGGDVRIVESMPNDPRLREKIIEIRRMPKP